MDSELGNLADRIGRTLRAHRDAQRMSLGDLARESGLSKTILARIEGGTGNPSMETMWRLSKALRVPLGELLAEDSPRVRTVRAGHGEALRADSGMDGFLLHADGREHRAEVFALRFSPGVEHRSEPHLPGVEEVIVCTAGRVRTGPDADPVELAPGDAIWFAADVPHAYAATGDAPAGALCLMLYPPAALR